jgi:hypothetical protein
LLGERHLAHRGRHERVRALLPDERGHLDRSAALERHDAKQRLGHVVAVETHATERL